MKNAMKRIMSLMLVALLLISAAPFALAAADVVKVEVKGAVTKGLKDVEIDGDSATVAELLAERGVDVDEYEIEKIYTSKQGTITAQGASASVAAGDKLSVILAAATDVGDEDDEIVDDEDDEIVDDEDDVIDTVEAIHVVVKVNTSNNVVNEFDKVPANGEYALVKNLLHYGWSKDWDNAYTFDHAWVSGKGDTKLEGKVYEGETLYIMLNDAKKEEIKDNNDKDDDDTYDAGYSDIVNKDPYNVYLNIYLNGDVNTIHKIVKITKTAAKDGKVTLGEVQEIVKDKYDAKDSDGIQYDGLYLATENWIGKFANDTEKYSTIDGLETERKHHVVNINVMIENAKVASSGTPDSSNPKTGDNIMIAVTTMALAAAALVSVTELKKRKMI